MDLFCLKGIWPARWSHLMYPHACYLVHLVETAHEFDSILRTATGTVNMCTLHFFPMSKKALFRFPFPLATLLWTPNDTISLRVRLLDSYSVGQIDSMKGGDEWAIRECTWNKINNQKLGQRVFACRRAVTRTTFLSPNCFTLKVKPTRTSGYRGSKCFWVSVCIAERTPTLSFSFKGEK